MRRRSGFVRLVVAGVLAAVVASCSAGHPRAVPATTTVPDPDPYVVPAVITPAYVNAVFVVLEHIAGNATRSLLAAHAVTPQVVEDVRAIYNDPLYSQELKIASQTLSGSLTNILKPPGDVVLTVQRIISATGTCIFVAADANFDAVLRHPGTPPASDYWGLQLKEPGDDPQQLNPTPWAFDFNAVYPTSTQIPDQCAS